MPRAGRTVTWKEKRDMGKPIDLTGQRFGRLVVIGRSLESKHGEATWLCQCDCGNTSIVRGSYLRGGNTQSCGCYGHELSVRGERRRTHSGSRDGGKKRRLYRIWIAMKTRCYNHNSKNYKNYGGRGITICAEWLHDFAAFRDWAMSCGYQDDLSIDRINVDGNYCPDNCRWATRKEQRHNRRDSK